MKFVGILFVTVLILVALGSVSTALIPVSATLAAASPHATPEKPLNEQQVGELIEQLQETLGEEIEDEGALDNIIEKWEAHKNLVGKTGSQIKKILFDDVRAVVRDKKVLDAIWANWSEEDEEEQNEKEEKPVTPPSNPKPQQSASGPALDEEEVDELIADLSEKLDEMLDDRSAVSNIVNRWMNRSGLNGKSEAQVKTILFEDVKAVIPNKVAQDDIWDYWNESGDEEDEADDKTVLQEPVKTETQIEAQAEMKELARQLLEDAKKNSAFYTEIMSLLRMENAYEPERLAGLCYLYVGDDAKCKSLATYRGYTAYMVLKKVQPSKPTVEKVSALFNRFDACEKAKDCSRLKSELIENFEAFSYSELARKFSTVWSFIFAAVNSSPEAGSAGFEPEKIAGLCLNELPGTEIEGCMKFVEASMYGFWQRFGNSNASRDKARYQALFNKTVRCSAPTNCSQVVTGLKQLPNTTLTPQAKNAIFLSAFMSANAPDLFDDDGWYNFPAGVSRCMKSAGTDACKQYYCMKSEMTFFLMHSVLSGNLLSSSDEGTGSASVAGKKIQALNDGFNRFAYDAEKKGLKPAITCPQP